MSDEDDQNTITVIPETPPQSDGESDVFNGDDSAEASMEEIEHKVTFKCIGCTKEQCYQETLKHVAQLRRGGNVVEAKLEPERTNPFDAKAIQIKCKVDGTWKKIGYLVSEVLDEVHEALASDCIINVGFEWVKMIIVWRTPGWYAGVNITRRGEWSKSVLTSQSTKT